MPEMKLPFLSCHRLKLLPPQESSKRFFFFNNENVFNLPPLFSLHTQIELKLQRKTLIFQPSA